MSKCIEMRDLASPNARACRRALLVGVLLLLAVADACSLRRGDPVKQPAFLTPIAEAQQAGVVPYWLGAEFRARGEVFRIDGEASFGLDPNGGGGIGFGYGARRGVGGILAISTYSNEATTDDTLRQLAADDSRGHSERVAVGSWSGEMYSIASTTRPVATLEFFLDVGEQTVIVTADAVGNGILGQDDNVLLDKDALVATLAQLRPYPQ